METTRKEKEFELITLWRVFCRFWVLILAITVLFGVLGFAYSALTDTTTYTGSASFWVNSGSSSTAGNVNQSNTMGAAQMASNYVELVKKDFLIRRAVQNSNLATTWNTTEDNAVTVVKGMIRATKSDPDSLVFSVSLTYTDPQVVYDATQAIQRAMEEVIIEVNGETVGSASGKYITIIDQVQSLDDIKMATPSFVKKGVIFAAAGFILSYCLFFVLSMFSSKVSNAETLADKYTLPVLAEIPMEKAASADSEVDDIPLVNDGFNTLRTAISLGSSRVVTVMPATGEASANYVAMGLAISYSRVGKKTLYLCNTGAAPEEGEESDNLRTVAEEGLLTYAELPKNGWLGEQIDGVALSKFLGNVEGYDAVIVDLPWRGKVFDAGAYSHLADNMILVVHKKDRFADIQSSIKTLSDCGIATKGFCFVE